MSMKKDTYQNIIRSLEAIHRVNENLLKEQEKSHKFHLQHNENVKKITNALNRLYQHCTEKGLIETNNQSESDLHSRVMYLVNEIRHNEIADLLMSLNDVSEIESLKDESLEAILPTICDFLHSDDDDFRGYGIGYLLELINRKVHLHVFGNKSIRDLVNKIIDGIKNIASDISKFEVKKEELQKIYQLLVESISVE